MRVLIVEDDRMVREGIVRALEQWGARVYSATTQDEGIEKLSVLPQLLIVDIRLPEKGSGIKVAEAAARLRPAPISIAISGEATASEAFHLAQVGVVTYIPKPLNLETFASTVEAVLSDPPDISPHVLMRVGSEKYCDVVRKVRYTMVEQALAKTGGNRVQAARLLNLTRQAVQQMIKDFEINSQLQTGLREGA